MSDLNKFRKEQLQDSGFCESYLDMVANADISKALLSARLAGDLYQSDLAKLTGIAQADISRLERGEGNPSLNTLKRLAKALGLVVRVSFLPADAVLSDVNAAEAETGGANSEDHAGPGGICGD